MAERKFTLIDREGPEDFQDTLAFQEQLVSTRIEDPSKQDSLILVEHNPVYTVGRSTPFSKPEIAPYSEAPWHEIGRGGKATFHGPGQVVAYPVFDLRNHGKDVHVFLRKLEEAIISTLKEFDIEGHQRAGLTGVWVKHESFAGDGWKKIAALGVGVRKWVSFHGLALNVCPDLEYFRAISPCGQDGESVTSFEELRALSDRVTPSIAEVKTVLSNEIAETFNLELDSETSVEPGKRPKWLKAKAPGSPKYLETQEIVKSKGLVTVCEEARCPNIGECWAHHTATFMIMGDLCTRRCAFCSVKDGLRTNLEELDILEPHKVGVATKELNLEHVVVTSVNRDDLEDMGAEHFYKTARAIKKQTPDCKIEFLIPDMRGKRELLEIILKDGLLDILNHNVETVPRLYRTVRPGAKLERSLDILRWSKEIHPQVKTKSGAMLGLGESREEVLELMDHLRGAGVDILTLGQYLQPSKKQLPVKRFITPEEFEDYKSEGLARGFSFVESGAFVRSSYHAWKHTSDSPTKSTDEQRRTATV